MSKFFVVRVTCEVGIEAEDEGDASFEALNPSAWQGIDNIEVVDVLPSEDEDNE